MKRIAYVIMVFLLLINVSAFTLEEQRDHLKQEIEDTENVIHFIDSIILVTDNPDVVKDASYIRNDFTKKLGQLKTSYGIVLDEIELAKDREYPTATYIWNALKQQGYNDYVAAGIMGNLMVETGGKTLNLKPYDYNPSGNFYGICQWSKKYYPEIFGCSLDVQIEYLFNTIETEFKTFGKLYKKGFGFDAFLELQNERQAALAFAKCYERCAGGYEGRMKCAEIAYDYFTK